MSIPQCPDHDLFCPCDLCEKYWQWDRDQGSGDSYVCNEVNEEQERELDQIHDLDGW